MVSYCCRWTSVVVVTNPFHQFRSLRAFKCAAKQSLPPGEQPQVRRNRIQMHWPFLCRSHVPFSSSLASICNPLAYD